VECHCRPAAFSERCLSARLAIADAEGAFDTGDRAEAWWSRFAEDVRLHDDLPGGIGWRRTTLRPLVRVLWGAALNVLTYACLVEAALLVMARAAIGCEWEMPRWCTAPVHTRSLAGPSTEPPPGMSDLSLPPVAARRDRDHSAPGCAPVLNSRRRPLAPCAARVDPSPPWH
jgi:hypothetical protein